nr:HD domain-containing protein [Candidatus Freyrarchaeum guaymaensis]
MESVIGDARELARRLLGGGFSHGYPHVERVMRYASVIAGEVPGINRELLETAVYLHDVGRPLGEPHAYYSSLIARSFLEERGCEEWFVRLVVNAVEYHSYSYALRRRVEPLSVEAKVLSDADKLDALGIVGFLRVFEHGYQAGRTVEESMAHFDEKIFKLKELMHFRVSRRIAEELDARARTALKWLKEELSER